MAEAEAKITSRGLRPGDPVYNADGKAVGMVCRVTEELFAISALGGMTLAPEPLFAVDSEGNRFRIPGTQSDEYTDGRG